MTTQDLKAYASPPTKLQTQLDFILVDSSGSMQPTWWDTLTAVQAYVEGLQKANVNSQIRLVTFDTTNRELTHVDAPISEWKDLLLNPVAGYFTMTPLYDAINLMGRSLRDLDPPRCAITIVTDGDEMGSEFTTLPQAKAVLDWCRAKGWQVTFIGAEFNNAAQAAMLGGNPASAIGVDRKLLPDAARALAAKRARYGLYGEAMHFTDDERQEFGGFLSDLSGEDAAQSGK
jgi:hypothetical protein